MQMTTSKDLCIGPIPIVILKRKTLTNYYYYYSYSFAQRRSKFPKSFANCPKVGQGAKLTPLIDFFLQEETEDMALLSCLSLVYSMVLVVGLVAGAMSAFLG
jgi:hypothetical protein